MSGTIKRDRESLRTTSPGLRDILNLLGREENQAHVERLAVAIIDRFGSGAAPSMAQPCDEFDALLRACREPSPPTVDIAAAVLENRVADLSTYDDATLLGSLAISHDFASQGSLDQWVDNNLPESLAKDLKVDTDSLKASLKALRCNDGEAWHLVITGQLRAALLLGSFVGCTDEDTRRIVRDIALLFQAAATRMRGALIRRWTTRPLGSAIRYDTGSSYVGRVLQANLVVPAKQIKLMVDTLRNNPAAAVGDTWLMRSPVLDLARNIETTLRTRGARISFSSAHRKELERLHSHIKLVADVTADQIRSENLGMRDFVEERLGVPASHACVLLATLLLDAPRQIEACIDAVRRAGPLPSTAMERFYPKAEKRQRTLVRMTQWLRLSARTDRHAFSGGNGDVNDKAGAQLVERVTALFQKTPPTTAYDALRVDPRGWFASIDL